MRFSQVAIESIASALPAHAMTTAAIEQALGPLYQRLGIAPGWLQAVTGIQERRVWTNGEMPSEVAARAAARALDAARVARHEVDVIVSTSVCRDYLEPSVACLVHGTLGLRPTALNFDVGNACLGFLTGMMTVANFIESGAARTGLVVAGEGSRDVIESTLERLLRPDATASTFRDNLATLTLGSGAVAMVLRRAQDSRVSHRFEGGIIRAATEHNRLCVGTEQGMITDPPKLLAEGVALAKRTWDELVEGWGWGPQVMAQYAMHQVGKANHDAILRTLHLPEERALRVYPTLGNCGAAGAPLALARAQELGRLRPGDRAAMLGIGSGLNVAMVSLTW
ncbi:MAG: 3-oxoacyl-ACP synthase III [Alphaproteobacteria bacterium]|nr:3-oxoacyl-ACP synthase III [Alphaproteobacteria bacterium]MCB9793759.1 3-oxoacyl-ACP synthase III [Alphaproteobacteria bacterium]